MATIEELRSDLADVEAALRQAIRSGGMVEFQKDGAGWRKTPISELRREKKELLREIARLEAEELGGSGGSYFQLERPGDRL